MKAHHRSWLTTTCFLLCVCAILFSPQWTSPASATTPEHIVQDAWRRAQRSGAYHFRTEIVQTTYPAPALSNVGRTTRQDTLYIEGQIDLPARTLLMNLWQGGGHLMSAENAIEVRIEGDRAYGRQRGMDWQPIDDFSGAFAPGNDLMAYLAGAQEIRALGAETRDVPTTAVPLSFDRYAFRVDGPAFARYLREQMVDYLREQGELPAGLSLDVSDRARQTGGEGEIWIDEQGFPLRLSVHLVYPPQEDGERVEAQIKTDLSDFAPIAESPLLNTIDRLGLSTRAQDWQRTAQHSALTLGVLGLVILLGSGSAARHRTERTLGRTLITLFVILSILLTPLLQSEQVYAFGQKLDERNARREEARAAQEARRALNEPDWDPRDDPLTAQGDDPEPSMPVYPLTPQQLQEEDFDPQADDDGDGLLNIQEVRLGTDRTDQDSDGDGITDDVEVRGFQGSSGDMWYLDPLSPDSNSDGLADNVECVQLLRGGTNQRPPSGTACQDSDGDDIPDVFDVDNDNDGVYDRVDLSPFSVMGGTGAPLDHDHPFVFGVSQATASKPVLVDVQMRPENPEHLSYALNVLDWPSGDRLGQVQRVRDTTFASDLSAAQRERSPSAANGDMRLIPMLEVELGGGTIPLALTTPAIEVALRGAISGTMQLTHRSSTQTRLQFDMQNWLNGGSRSYTVELFKTTCATIEDGTSAAESFTVSPSTPQHDVSGKAVKWADGTRAVQISRNNNSVCADIGNIVNGPYQDKMIDPAPLEAFGLTVREKNHNGDLLLYAPLSVVNDDTGGARAAFAARLLFEPGSNGWGQNQQMRLVWMVHMLTDWCDTTGFSPTSDATRDIELQAWCLDPAHRQEQMQVVHTYYEPWRLTGLSVREDHGASVAIAFEDPTVDTDPNNDDILWMLAHGLEASFVTGRKGDNTQRDITPQEIKRRFDPSSGTSTDEERWDIDRDAIRVDYYDRSHFQHQGDLAQIPMTLSKDALDEFLSGGSSIADAPTLLFAREEYFRAANLDAVAHTNSAQQLSVTLDRTAFQLETVAAVQWAPYRYRNGTWESYPIDEYMALLDLRTRAALAELDGFSGTEEDSELAREGAVMAAQASYIAFYNGLVSIVQRESEVLETPEFQLTDRQLLDEIRSQVRLGRLVGKNAVLVMTISKVINTILLKIEASKIEQMIMQSLQQAFPSIDFAKQATALGKWARFKAAVSGIKSSVKGFASDKWKLIVTELRDTWAWIKDNKGLALAGAVLALVTVITAAVLGGTGRWQVALSVLVLGLSIFLLCKSIYNLAVYGASEGIQAASRTIKIFGTTQSVSQVAGVIGLIIGVVISFGFFVYAWAAGGLRIGSLALNAAFAQTIAQIVVAAIMFAIAHIPVVGQIIVAVIAVIDALVAVICTAIGEEARTHAVGQWLCRGLTGLATELIRNLIYDAHELVDMDLTDRLQIFDFSQAMVSTSRGIAVNNSIQFGLSVTSTLQLEHVFPKWEEMIEGWKDGTRLIPIDWKSLSYGYQFNNNALRTANFQYRLQSEAVDYHEDLERYDQAVGALTWTPGEDDIGKFEIAPYFVVDSASAITLLDEAGINRQIPLYLSEAFAAPVQECFAIPNPTMLPPGVPFYSLIPVCRVTDTSATNHIDIGSKLYLDVFPETLAQFYDLQPKKGGVSLAWGQNGLAFPVQRDADGDGLTSPAFGGSDPDDAKWDTDGDGLSDLFEDQIGSDPTRPDADQDGLSDKVELRIGSDPYRADSDGDGLTDAQEVSGWAFVYDLTAAGQLSTWVRSDPLAADADQDGLTDFQEKTFGFHPRVPSAANALTLDSELYEPNAPRLLLRFDDAAGATTFPDGSGYSHTGACESAHCPAAGKAGRYGTAVRFDGSNDGVRLEHSALNELTTDFTIAAWIKPQRISGWQSIIATARTESNDGFALGLVDDELRFTAFGINTVTTTGAGLHTGQWTHVAAAVVQIGPAHFVRLYINGQLEAFAQLSSPIQADLDDALWIAKTTATGSAASRQLFRGLIDEPMIWDRVLDEVEMEHAMLGAHNPSDAYVQPGDPLRYLAAVKNELFGRQAQGLLSTHLPADAFGSLSITPTPFVLQPQDEVQLSKSMYVVPSAVSGAFELTQVAGAVIADWREQSGFANLWLPLNESSGARTFRDFSGLVPPHNGTCSGSTCPTAEVEGYADHALDFDGADDYVTLPAADELGLTDSSFTVAAWINGRAFGSGDRAILGTDQRRTNRGLRLMVRDGKPYMGFYGNELASTLELETDRWYHLVFRYHAGDQEQSIFVNGQRQALRTGAAAFAGTGDVLIGRAQGGKYFGGQIDDLRVYGRALDNAEIQTLYGLPVLDMHFDSSIMDGAYLDDSGFDNLAVGNRCPAAPNTQGISGQALYFSGVDYCEMPLSPSLDLRGGAFTLAMWLYPKRSGSNVEGIWGSYASYLGTGGNNTDFARFSYPSLFKIGRKLRFGFGDGTVWRHFDTGDVLTLDTWNHVVVSFGPTYDQDGNFLENRVTFYVDGTRVKSEGVGSNAPYFTILNNFLLSLGRASTQSRLWLDRYWVDDERDGSGKAEICLAWDETQIYMQEKVEDNNNDGKRYDLDIEQVFVNNGVLRMWEDDRDHTSRGQKCGTKPDDGDDALDGGTRDDGGWWFSTNNPGFGMTGYAFSGDTEGTLYLRVQNPSIPYQGRMDNLMLYKRTLWDEEVLELYLSASAAMRLRLDDAPGSERFKNTVDLSEQGDAYCTGTGCPTAGLGGRIDRALWFDGQNDVLHTHLNLDQSSDSPGATLMAWVYPDSDSSGQHYVIGTNDGNADWSLLREGNQWQVLIGGGDSYAGPTVDVGQWQHIAVVLRPGNKVKIYKNGVRAAAGGTVQSNNHHSTVTIGAKPDGSRLFDGRIDEVRVFHRALPAADILTVYEDAPVLQLHLEDKTNTKTFVDDSVNDLQGTCSRIPGVIDYCPKAGEGIRGQVGLAAEFDGVDDQIEIADHPALNLTEFTVGGWFKPSAADLGRIQSLIRKGDSFVNYSLRLTADLVPEIDFHDGTYTCLNCAVSSATPLLPNRWNHVIATYDGRDLRIYVNGYEQGSRHLLHSLPQGNGDPLFLSRQGLSFAGRMDEIVLYQRALSAYEVRDLFWQQGKWVEDRQTHTFTVDDDDPTSTLRSYDPAQPYRANQYTVMHIAARDPTSGIAQVELGVRRQGAAAITWLDAPRCVGDEGELAGDAWCPAFDPTQFGGPGRYELQTRATDLVGYRETPAQTYVLYVDDQPPAVTATQAGRTIGARWHPTRPGIWRVRLSGTVSDPALPGNHDGSGVQQDKLWITLLDQDGYPAGGGAQLASVANGEWEIQYVLGAANPSGTYTLRASAADRAIVPSSVNGDTVVQGNHATRTLGTITVDATPPQTRIDLGRLPTATITSTLTLSGQVSDTLSGVNAVQIAFVPQWPGSVFYNAPSLPGQMLHLPLDDTPDANGVLIYDDLSGYNRRGTCSGTSCPATASGHSGGAAAFDGGQDAVHVRSFGGASTATASAWVYRTGQHRGRETIFSYKVNGGCGLILSANNALSTGSFKTRYLNHYPRFSVNVDGTWQQVTHELALPKGTWVHLTGTYDGQTIRLYRDGQQVATLAAPGSMSQCPGDIWVGGQSNRPNRGFPGRIDELQMYDRALSDAEIGTIYRGSGPVLSLPLDRPWVQDGTRLPDVSGWQSHGTMSAGGDATTNKSRLGQVGLHALQFDGVDDGVTVPYSPAFDLDQFSIGTWFYPQRQAAQAQPLVVVQDDATQAFSYGLWIAPNSRRVRFGMQAGDCSTAHTYTSRALNFNAWHHALMTYDGTTLKLYIDGVLDREIALSATVCHIDAPLRLGHTATAAYRGQLDDVIVYPRAINALEAQSLYGRAWREAALGQSGASATTWTAQIPPGLEGAYRIDLRARDTEGQWTLSGQNLGAWETNIDTLAPRITVTGTLEGTSYHYRLSAQDWNLTEAGLLLPCDISEITGREYYHSPWYLSLSGQTTDRSQRLYGLTAECTLPGWALPGQVGTYDTPGLAWNVAVSGTHAYVADGKAGLIVLDVSDPALPRLVSQFDTPGSAHDVVLPSGINTLATTGISLDPGTPPEQTATLPETSTALPFPSQPTAEASLLEPAHWRSTGVTRKPLAQAGTPDILVESVTVEPPTVGLNEPLTITAVISNAGDVDVLTNFWTGLYDDATPMSCLVCNNSLGCENTTSLAAGISTTVVFTLAGLQRPGPNTFYVQADTYCVVFDDADLANNTVGPVTATVRYLTVTHTIPAGNGRQIERSASISASFSTAIDTSTITPQTFIVRGTQAGPYSGTFAPGLAAFTPGTPFKPGETIRAYLNSGIRAPDGSALIPYAWQMRAAVAGGTGAFRDGGQRPGSPNVSRVRLADLDGDGDLDALTLHSLDPAQVWINQGGDQGGTPGVLTDSGQSLGGGATLWDGALGDLDGDGDLDIMFAIDGTSGNQVWINQGGDQGGTPGVFADSGQRLSNLTTYAVALGDLDGDGDLDAVAANGGLSVVDSINEVWLNDGNALFTAGWLLGETTTFGLALGDVDNDGDLDVVALNEDGNHRLWPNDGRAQFDSNGQIITTTGYPNGLALDDLDGDGDLDLVIGHYDSDTSLWINQGGDQGGTPGVFADSGQSLDRVSGMGSLALGDVDADGDLDMLLANGRLWVNQGGAQDGTTGVFTDSMTAVGFGYLDTVALGDLDGDGDLDAFAGWDSIDGENPIAGPVVWFNDPLAVDDQQVVAVDSTGNTLNVLANDGFVGAPTLVLSQIGTPAHGTAAIVGSAVVYTPTPAYAGNDVFTYTVHTAGGHLQDTATITVGVGGANSTPVARDDDMAADEDVPAILTPLDNDDDPDGHTPILIAVSTPTPHGTAQIVGNTVVYTPSLDWNGIDVFTYTISDGAPPVALTAQATITVTVSAVNDAPTLIPGADPVVPEDAGAQSIPAWATGIAPGPATALDEAGQTLTLTVSNNNNALFSVQPVLDPSGALSFTPAPNAYGAAQVWIGARDDGGTANGGQDSAIYGLAITITAVNDAPQASDVIESTLEDVPLALTLVPTHVSDVDGDTPAVYAVGVPAHGTATATGTGLIYTPTLNWSGVDVFTYTVTDNSPLGALSDTATVTIAVESFNDAPTLDPLPDLDLNEDEDAQTVHLSGIGAGPGESQAITVTATSGDETLISPPAVGYASPDASGTLTVQPLPDAFGTTTIAVTVTDGVLETTHSFAVYVHPVNDAPTLNPIPNVEIYVGGGVQTLPLGGIGAGPGESQTLTVTATSDDTNVVAHPQVDYVNPDTTASLQLVPMGSPGAATVTVTVTDGALETVRSFYVTVSLYPPQPYAYVADWSQLHVLDVSDPTRPALSGSYGGAPARSVALSGPYAYVAAGYGGLRVLDVSNPGAPTEVGSIGFGGDAQAVAVSGHYAYVADGNRQQLRVISIVDPTAPHQVAALPMPYTAYDVDIASPDALGRVFAYVACGHKGVQVVHVTDPLHPTLVSLADSADARGVTVWGSTLYVADGYAGVQAFDLTLPIQLLPTQRFDTPGRAQSVAVHNGLLYVADLQTGIQVINPHGRQPQGTACDQAGNCATTAPEIVYAQSSRSRGLALSITAQNVPPQPNIALAGVPAVLDSAEPISVTGSAHVTIPHSLLAITVTVDGAPLYSSSWASGTITQTDWAVDWTPGGPGLYELHAQALDDAGRIYRDAMTVTVDIDYPAVAIAPTVLTTTHYYPPRAIDVTGMVTDAGGVAQVDVTVLEQGIAYPTVLWDDAAPVSWLATWHHQAEPMPDGEWFTVTARAVDIVGRATTVTETVLVDVVPPTPVTLTLTSAGSPVPPGTTLRTPTPTLHLAWPEATDGSGVAGYDLGWAATLTGTAYDDAFVSTGTGTASYAPPEGSRVGVQLAGRDLWGNVQTQWYGPVYVDAPHTPDYVLLDGTQTYRGWMDSGCTLIGTDRRSETVQRLYTTWSAEALRLAWTGADWAVDGDLFIYLDTQPGGTTTAYNPYTASPGTALYLPGVTPSSQAGALAADYAVWVQDGEHASLLRWDGSAWMAEIDLAPLWYQFDRALNGGQTDLYLPLELLGIDDPVSAPLDLVAFAAEPGALRLWATMPPANPLDSALVAGTGTFAGDERTFALTQRYRWSALGAGVCPNGSDGSTAYAYTDGDLELELIVDPAGTTYSFVQDNLAWLWSLLMDNPPADVTSYLDFMNIAHPPLAHGQAVSYTLRYENVGREVAAGVQISVTAQYALDLDGGNVQTLHLGDVPPGGAGQVVLHGTIDVGASTAPWAAVEAQVYDAAHAPADGALDWLWAYHQVDRTPPQFFGLSQPRYLISAGANTLHGYAFDDAGVPEVTIEIGLPSGGTGALTCTDDTPLDGAWGCNWNATAANGVTPTHGAQFDLRLQAVDASGQSSGWSAWQPLEVDALPPSVTLSATAAPVGGDLQNGDLVGAYPFTLFGQAADDGGLERVEICLDGACERLSLDLAAAPASYNVQDVPADPLAVPGCGSPMVRTWEVTETFALEQVQLGLTARHERRDDLWAELESPTGTRVTLLEDDGVSGTAYQHYDLALSDRAALSFDAGVGDDPAWPYEDRLARPAAPLIAFQGQDAAGTWTLRMCDHNPAADEGQYMRGRLVLIPQDNEGQTTDWSYPVDDLGALDHISKTFEVYAVDRVGNRTTSPNRLTLWVDNVAPVLTPTQVISQPLESGGWITLTGQATDGGKVAAVLVVVDLPTGETRNDQAEQNGTQWQYALDVQREGIYRLWVSAVDQAGNVTAAEPIELIFAAPRGIQHIYMPLVFRGYQPPPAQVDLEARAEGMWFASTSEAEVIVTNAGPDTLSAGFRVDLYLDPQRVPQAGDLWTAIGTYGAHWYVNQPLGGGESIALPLDAAVSQRYPPQLGGMMHAYIQVDTLSEIVERNEQNNLVTIDLDDIDAPDLIVNQITATATGIEVVIKNQGEASVVDEFWVDVYINPNPPPTSANQVWRTLCAQGLVWGVTESALPIKPNATLTLTIDGPYYRPEYSEIAWPLPSGTVVYAQVDSANVDTRYSGVLEIHEVLGWPYNNIDSTLVP